MGRRTGGGWLRVSLLTLLGILAALTAVIGYCLLNPNTLRPVACWLAEAITGRTLVLEGDIDLEISLEPRVTARLVRFGNAEWSSNPDMATAGYVMVQIDLPSLLDYRVHLLDLDVREATVYLEDRVEGAPNWELFGEDDGAEWSLFVQGLEIEDARILADIGELEPIDLEIPELIESSDAAGNVHLDGHGRLNGDPWRVEGRIGTFDELLAAGRIEMDIYVMVDDSEVTARGTVGELATLSELDLSLELYGPDAEVLGEIFGMAEAFQEDIALTAAIRPTEAGHAMAVNGHVSAFQIEAVGTVLDLENLDGWDAEVHVAGPEAGIFGAALQIRGLPEGPFEVGGRVHIHGGDVDLTDVEINTEDASLALNANFEAFPRREGAIANLQLAGPDISQFRVLTGMPTLPVAPFALILTLDATGDEVLESSLQVGTHTLTAAGPIGEFPTYEGTRLQTVLSGEDIAQILALAGIEDTLSGPYRAVGTINVNASGLSVSDAGLGTGPLEVTGEADLPDFGALERFTVTGRLAISSLQEAGVPFGIDDLPATPLTVQARIASTESGFQLEESVWELDDMRAEAYGDLGAMTGLVGIDLEIAASGPDIKAIFDDAAPGAGIPFALTTRLVGAEDAIELIGLKLTGEGGSFDLDARIGLAEGLVGSHFSIRGRGTDLSGVVPSLPNYKPPQEPWEASIEVALPGIQQLEVEQSALNVGSVQVSLAGVIDIADQTSTDLVFEASGDTFNDVGMIGHVAWPDMPFRISTKLDGTTDAINVAHLEAYWGESDVAANGSISLIGRPAVVLRGRSSTMILIDLQKAIFGEQEDVEPEDDSTRVFPDTSILPSDTTALDFDLDVDIQIETFRGMRSSLDDVDLKLKLQGDTLLLERAAFRDAVGSFNATGVLRPEGEQAFLELKLVGDEADFRLFTSDDQPPEAVPRYTLDVAVSGIGSTVAELAGNLNGKILVHSDGGRIDNDLLDAFAGDFLSNVLDVLNPFANSEPFTPMECMVINTTIDDGKVKLEPGFVMRTNRVNMFVYGDINLKNERLDLSLATQARRGIGISAASITNPYFKVGGTLSSPALQLDPASAAIAASVATATAGLSIVIRGFLERLLGEQNPCPQFLNYEPKQNKPTGG